MLRELQRTTQDLEKIYKLLMRMHGEVGFDVGAVVPEKVLLQVVTCVEHGVVYVLDEGDFKGALGLRPDQPWWGDFEFLIDGFFFIAPESRSLANARKFLIAAKEYAAARKMPLFVQLMSAVDLARKEIFFKREGFEPRGALMEWRP